jgi:hypothetical protein
VVGVSVLAGYRVFTCDQGTDSFGRVFNEELISSPGK